MGGVPGLPRSVNNEDGSNASSESEESEAGSTLGAGLETGVGFERLTVAEGLMSSFRLEEEATGFGGCAFGVTLWMTFLMMVTPEGLGFWWPGFLSKKFIGEDRLPRLSTMCGIVFSLSRGSPQRSISPLIQAASHRGQHHHQLHSTTLADLYLHFFSSVLHLRGPKLYSQPVVDPAGDVLCYNGQVFQGLELDPQKDSDTAVLWNSLRDHVDRDGSSGISQLLGSIEGP